jgi:hypothetical protein
MSHPSDIDPELNPELYFTSIIETCDVLLDGGHRGNGHWYSMFVNEEMTSVRAYIIEQEDTKHANALDLKQTEATCDQLGAMHTHLTTSRDDSRESSIRCEEGWKTCIKAFSDIDTPSPSVAGKRPRTVRSDLDEE